jgi:hypothetical protein
LLLPMVVGVSLRPQFQPNPGAISTKPRRSGTTWGSYGPTASHREADGWHKEGDVLSRDLWEGEGEKGGVEEPDRRNPRTVSL